MSNITYKMDELLLQDNLGMSSLLQYHCHSATSTRV